MKKSKEKRGRVLHYIHSSHGNAASPCFIDMPLKLILLDSSSSISLLYPMNIKTSSLLGLIPSAEPLGRCGNPTKSCSMAPYQTSRYCLPRRD